MSDINNTQSVEKEDTDSVVEQKEIITPTARNLLRIRTVWPLFRKSEVIVDELKVSIIKNSMFNSGVVSLLIKDITDVAVENNPFFASLRISGGDYKETGKTTIKEGKVSEEIPNVGPLRVGLFSLEDARKARRVIQGLLVMDQQKINTSKLTSAEVLAKAEQLGSAR